MGGDAGRLVKGSGQAMLVVKIFMLQHPQSSQGILPCLHSMSKSVFLLSERPQKLLQYPLPFCDWHGVLPFSGHRDIWIGWSPILGLGSLLPVWPLAASCLSLLFQSPHALFSGLFPPTFHILPPYSSVLRTPLNTPGKPHRTWLCTIYFQHSYTVVVTDRVCKKRKSLLLFHLVEVSVTELHINRRLCTGLRPNEMQVNQGLPHFPPSFRG